MEQFPTLKSQELFLFIIPVKAPAAYCPGLFSEYKVSRKLIDVIHCLTACWGRDCRIMVPAVDM